jgi:competence protein ComEA
MRPERRDSKLLVHARGGRFWAPSLSVWLPIAAKIALAMGVAVLLAVIGTRAAAHAWNADGRGAPLEAPAAAMSTELPPPQSVARVDDGRSSAPDAGTARERPLEAEPPSALLPDGRIVLNSAGEEQLVRLPGVGPTRALAILALRERIGRFRSVDQLRRVKGIGRKTLQRIAPLVVVDAPSSKAGGKDGGSERPIAPPLRP